MKTIIVPVSGGKDSQLVLHMAVHTGEQVVPVFTDTGMEHSLTHKHLETLENAYRIQIVRLRSKYASIPDLIRGEGVVPSHVIRICTRIQKQEVLNTFLEERSNTPAMEVWFGMRAQESPARRKRLQDKIEDFVYEFQDFRKECPVSIRRIPTRVPIVHFTTATVFSTLRGTGVPINPLYKLGHHRVGCAPCVFSGIHSLRLWARDAEARSNILDLQDALSFVRMRHEEATLPFDADFALYQIHDDDPFGFNPPADDEPPCAECSI